MSELNKRVYVGNILQNGESCFEELYQRFKNFGTINDNDSKFDIHGTFGYLNMTFTDEHSFKLMRKNFNNVNFKGNVLRVDIAKPNFQDSWKLQHEKDIHDNIKKQKLIDKRSWEHHKKLENISMSWIDHKEVMKGRMRKIPRNKRDFSKITFRIDVEGSLKVYKCYKTKLWGYERNKELGDLVYKFTGNKWRNGFDHIVDKLDYSRSKHSIHFKRNNNTLTITQDSNKDENDSESDEHMAEEEKEKNNEVLAEVLKGFDFDKTANAIDPDDADEFGISENNANNYNEEENYNEYSNNYQDNYYSEQDNYNEEEYYDNKESNYNSKPNNKEDVENEMENSEKNDDDEEEFIPIFTDKPVNNVISGTISNTETLRSLFNPDADQNNSRFKLMSSAADDIVPEQNKLQDAPLDIPPPDQTADISYSKDKNHLFFGHFKSPFLLGQTQLTRVTDKKNTDTLNNWDQEFWDNRGTWMREMKNKKRDAIRQLQKKRAKDGKHILV